MILNRSSGFHPWFYWDPCCSMFNFCAKFCRSLFFLCLVLFAIVVAVILLFMASGYPIDISKLYIVLNGYYLLRGKCLASVRYGWLIFRLPKYLSCIVILYSLFNFNNLMICLFCSRTKIITFFRWLRLMAFSHQFYRLLFLLHSVNYQHSLSFILNSPCLCLHSLVI
jgi:uncharacterized membrane protein YedE/YeeE